MVGMAPISLAILHHLKVSYDPPKKKLPICASTFELSNLGISWISISLSSVQTRVTPKAKEEPKAQGLQDVLNGKV